jgi:hypothetical protein
MDQYTTIAALLQGAAGKENHGATEAKRQKLDKQFADIL